MFLKIIVFYFLLLYNLPMWKLNDSKEGREMPKTRKDGKPVSFFLKRQVVEDLTEYCNKTGYSKTVAVEKAIEEYLKKQKER